MMVVWGLVVFAWGSLVESVARSIGTFAVGCVMLIGLYYAIAPVIIWMDDHHWLDWIYRWSFYE